MNANPDPQQVQTVVSFLAPFLPYLIAGATEAAKGLGKKAGEVGGEQAWKQAQALWAKLKARLSRKQEAKKAVIALDPADEEEVASFARTLIATLEADAELAAELGALLGKDRSVQKVIARNQSLVAKVVQRGPGEKLVEATDGSTAIDITQET